MSKRVIGKHPNDGRDWECQCARCGSSMSFQECDNCDGNGEIEDDDWQADDEYYTCGWCGGDGGAWVCLSSPDWCDSHPNEGRADVKRGIVEWFTFDAEVQRTQPPLPAEKEPTTSELETQEPGK